MRLRSLLVCTLMAGGTALWAPEAHACGGCFAPPVPPGEQSSVVTDHRMVFAISPTESTLYDQITYTGSPKDFAWILPISGTVEVGVSAQSLFNALDQLSSVVVTEPPRNCPPYPSACYSNYGDSASAGSSGSSGGSLNSPVALDAGAAPPIEVIKSEVVGPYEAKQLHPTTADPKALENWLADHDYAIPDDIKPVIADYVANHFNFLALKLVPGKDVKSMRPVRVTTQGSNVALPLKMVAAGTGATVGITLWVVSSGRYEPTNFGSFIITNEELSWDWNKGASNFKDLRAQKQAVSPGKLWEIESSLSVSGFQLQNTANSLSGAFGAAGGDYIDYTDPDTQVTKTAAEVQQDDFDKLFAVNQSAGAGGSVQITRIRADIAHSALTSDLLVGASSDQSQLARTRLPSQEIGQPLCPVYQNCRQIGSLPRDQAIAANNANASTNVAANNPANKDGTSGGFGETRGSENDGTFTCTTMNGGAGSNGMRAPLTAAFGFVAVAVGRAIRQRRKQR